MLIKGNSASHCSRLFLEVKFTVLIRCFGVGNDFFDHIPMLNDFTIFNSEDIIEGNFLFQEDTLRYGKNEITFTQNNVVFLKFQVQSFSELIFLNEFVHPNP